MKASIPIDVFSLRKTIQSFPEWQSAYIDAVTGFFRLFIHHFIFLLYFSYYMDKAIMSITYVV